MSDYINQFKNIQLNFSPNNSWTINSKIESRIKDKIEKVGTPLKEWDISIYRGILTGYNEAFIINQNIRDELINISPKADEIIRPILRGRDIQKYKVDWGNLYIIGTFPSLHLDIEEFHSIKKYLMSFNIDRLKQTGEPGSRKKTNNNWFETQDSISYWEDFFKPKIIWGEISDKSKFAYDENNFFIEATSFIMTGEKLKYLLGLLNSKLLEWYFNQIGTATGVGTNRWKKYTIELLPVKRPSLKELELVEDIILKIISSTSFDKDVHIKEIDKIVYEMYNLNEEEKQYISNINT